MVGPPYRTSLACVRNPLSSLVLLCFAGRSGYCGARAQCEASVEPMRLSRYFLPILRETPKEAEIVSHRLTLRARMVRQEASGIYAFLSLGLRVLHKLSSI